MVSMAGKKGVERPSYTDQDKEKAVQDLENDFSGANFDAVAKKHGCSPVSLRNWAQAQGVYSPKSTKSEIISPDAYIKIGEALKTLEPDLANITKLEKEYKDLADKIKTAKLEYKKKQDKIIRDNS